MISFLKKRWWLILLAVIAAAVLGFVIWAMTPLGPMPEAIAAMESDEKVSVSTSPWLIFTPTTTQPQSGIIIYPGGRVDPRSYAPLGRAFAEQGHLAVIVPMPLNLAVFSPGKAQAVLEAYPEIEYWGIAGHSLGGAMAANFIANHPEAIDRLALWAAYPAEGDSLAGVGLRVSSIFASLDGLVDPATIADSSSLLPPSTQFVEITGGNHAQFGWYGDQPGDNQAEISRSEQQQQIVKATNALLEERK
jgi:hypothetical protein